MASCTAGWKVHLHRRKINVCILVLTAWSRTHEHIKSSIFKITFEIDGFIDFLRLWNRRPILIFSSFNFFFFFFRKWFAGHDTFHFTHHLIFSAVILIRKVERLWSVSFNDAFKFNLSRPDNPKANEKKAWCQLTEWCLRTDAMCARDSVDFWLCCQNNARHSHL